MLNVSYYCIMERVHWRYNYRYVGVTTSTLALQLRYVRELCHDMCTTYFLHIYVRSVSLSIGYVDIISTV